MACSISESSEHWVTKLLISPLFPKNQLTKKRSPKFLSDWVLTTYSTIVYEATSPFKTSLTMRETCKIAETVFARMVEVAKCEYFSAKKMEWELRVINTPEINAFSLAGGKIGISTGFIQELQAGAIEKEIHPEHLVAAVLGHEICHVLANHHRLNLQGAVLATITVHYLTFYAIPFIYKFFSISNKVPLLKVVHKILKNNQTAAIALKLLVNLLTFCLTNWNWTQPYEFEADKFGIQLAHKASYNPQGALELQKILLEIQGNCSLPFYFYTHPFSQKRLEANEKTVQELKH